VMERNEIEKIIPHRPPFLWIEPGGGAGAGHSFALRGSQWMRRTPSSPDIFPRGPILPGVLMIEAVAQTAAVMMGSATAGATMDSALLAAVHRFKFFKPVAPAWSAHRNHQADPRPGAMACIEGTVSVLGEKVASGELSVGIGTVKRILRIRSYSAARTESIDFQPKAATTLLTERLDPASALLPSFGEFSSALCQSMACKRWRPSAWRCVG